MVERLYLRALVTGATGFVGGHLVRRLLAEGWTVRVLIRRSGGLCRDIAVACEVVVGDLADESALAQAVAGVDVVFHCAANVATWSVREAYDHVNVDGVLNLLSAIEFANPDLRRLVHLSTVDVYGFPELPADEGSPLDGAGFGYGESKLQGEVALRRRCTEMGLAFSVIRPANIIGPGSQFVLQIGKALQSGVMLKIDHGEVNAGFLYIENLIDVLIWSAQSERAVGQIYNVRDACDITWQEFLSTFRKAIHGKGIVINLSFPMAMRLADWTEKIYSAFLPEKEPVLHRLLVNIFGRTCGHSAEKIRAHARLSGQVCFAEAMQHSAAWFLENVSRR